MKAGITACSDGRPAERKQQHTELISILADCGIEAVTADHIYACRDAFSGTDEERAADLMGFYEDEEIRCIFDISGGDLANGVLKYLDWDRIASSSKVFWGYSDLTTVINAIYAKTGKESVLYQVRNLVSGDGALQRKRFSDYISGRNEELFAVHCNFLQGDSIGGKDPSAGGLRRRERRHCNGVEPAGAAGGVSAGCRGFTGNLYQI